ncbi:EamA family transporter [Glutamicibacter sp. TV12E]|uniref:EamA family transporter n=1 Tax=Glutamicibacter sp. TV12E TaxID=3446362 RepID=UPI004033301C
MNARSSLHGVPPWTLAITAMLAVQLSNATSVFVIGQVGAGGTAWLRMCFGVLFLWIIARPNLRSIRKKDIPALIVLGVVTGYMTALFLEAVDRIPLGTAVSIEFLGPLTVAGLMSKNRKALVWPALAILGVVLLTEPWHGKIDGVGVLFALGAGICWGSYNILTQHVGDRFSGISGLSLTIPVAAIATMPVGLHQVISHDFAWWTLPAAAGIALITPVIAFGLEMLALKRMTHTAFGTLLSVEPAFGVLIGLLILSQTPTWFQALGIIVVIAAGAGAQRGGRRRSHELPLTDLPLKTQK